MTTTQIGSILGCLTSYFDHLSIKATTYLTSTKKPRSLWQSLPIYHLAMILVIITSLICVFVLDRLSKILSLHLSDDNAKARTTTTLTQSTHHFPDLKEIEMPEQQQRQFGRTMTLTDLPPELRLQIYDHVLPTSHPYIVGRDYGHSTSRLGMPALCHVNRQLRDEVVPLFFGGNTVIVDVHILKDLREFLKWVRVLQGAERVGYDWVKDERGDGVGVLGWMRDLRVTVGGCLLVDIVLKAGRRRYGDERVVAAKPMLDNSLKWDRKNILHYVRDPLEVKPKVEELLEDVLFIGSGDSGLRVQHLIDLVEIVFKIEKLDAATRKVFLSLKEVQ